MTDTTRVPDGDEIDWVERLILTDPDSDEVRLVKTLLLERVAKARGVDDLGTKVEVLRVLLTAAGEVLEHVQRRMAVVELRSQGLGPRQIRKQLEDYDKTG